MGSKLSLILILLLAFSAIFDAVTARNHNQNSSAFSGIEFPDHMSFNAVSTSETSGCSFATSRNDKQSEPEMASNDNDNDNDDDDDEEEERGGVNVDSFLSLTPNKQAVKLHLSRRSASGETEPKKSLISSTIRDLARIQTLHRRITEKKNQNSVSRLKNKARKQPEEQISPVVAPAASPESYGGGFSGQLIATLESGVGFGSGEYFMDVFVGTPPKHYSLILDTGSDLNWIQCVPCHDCFEQNGPYYDPKESSSFRNIGCHDPRCQLVSSPDPPQPCKAENQTCPYYYWYGDSSNTTGDFALETFTVNLTTNSGKAEFHRVEDIMFGCGHWNRGLFKGAAGLLGLGRGSLSFSSQLQSLYGHSFSYCLVDRNSDTNVSSKLIFGEDKDLLSHPELNFTALVAGKENPVDTFYYLQIKSILVGGEALNISEETWQLSPEGAGGTIIDSGTTLSYFTDLAYQTIKEAFLKKVKGYQIAKIEDFPLDLCYNVSGVDNMELPDFGIVFSDGAVWNFPVENYFIQIDPHEVVCLAFKNTSANALSIIGNYQQQNFHILYDTKKSRLGYAPMNCASV
ncbi:Aspartic peptidase [Parasponia andersonii]|uniref:Aspartic peptidase n=1 Tax=Parasponia andersonii TaxID=3476 RepID=A0A2P5A7P8_PARAD|nr:Aspartic peptidase [Parasponia andersonii]